MKKEFMTIEPDKDYVITVKNITECGQRNSKKKTHRKPQKPRKTYTEEEAVDYLETMQTAGRKGVVLPRINLAFTPSNYEYVKTMAQATGQTLTQFVNMVLKESKKLNSDTYQQAIAFLNSFKHDC